MRADRPTAARAPTPPRGASSRTPPRTGSIRRYGSCNLTRTPRPASSPHPGENDCVKVAELPYGARAVRDSKNPEREPLRFTASEWVAFRAGVIAGEL
ncbi:DUF397 domain-containing protein [Streptomyces sp. NPDC051639]|uniref:DUF397 domain-containing protein n=1 Tax=unclassified Streptomyces TaxID=2593676 RepID=UPI0034229320